MAQEDKDEIIAICNTANENLTIGISVPCRKCGTAAWLSDSTIESIKESHPGVDIVENPPIVLCLTCGIEHMNNSANDPVIIPPSKKQLEELKQGIKQMQDAKRR